MTKNNGALHDSDARASYAQERIWFLDGLEPDAYIVAFNLRLTGALDTQALERSLNEIVRRHEILRTTFAMHDGTLIQHLHPELDLTLDPVRLDDLPPGERESRLRRLAQQEAAKQFDLARGPLIRAGLVRLDDEDHVLLLTLHHIVCDGWSMEVLMNELSTLYEAHTTGRESPLEELPMQYAGYASWQRRFFEGPAFDEQLAYWKRRLAGAPPHVELPYDTPRREALRYRGGVEQFHLPRKLVQTLRERCRQPGTTPFMTYLSAFAALLSRYGSAEDIVIGAPAANRNRLKESELMIGFFVNTLALRVDLSGDPPFATLLGRVRETVIGALANQDLPFEVLVRELDPVRERGVNPIFQVGFAYHTAPATGAMMPGLTVRPLPDRCVTPGVTFDLNCSLIDDGTDLTGALEYNENLFSSRTVAGMASHLRALLEGIAADPEARLSSIPILSRTERRRIVVEWNETARRYDDERTIVQLIESCAAGAPERIAVTAEETQITYEELNRRANMLARHLVSLGVGPEGVVGILMDRSIDMVVSILAVLKAGGAYLPIDPYLPDQRIAFIYSETGPVAIITQSYHIHAPPEPDRERIPLDVAWHTIARHSDENLDVGIAPQNAAYIIYTSGSTGRPKGVVGTHGGLSNRLHWMQEAFGLSPGDTVLQKTPFNFDVSIWEFLWPLMIGARLVMARPEGHRDARYLAEVIEERAITTIHFVPSMLDIFFDEGDAGPCRSLRLVISSGEALPPAAAEKFHDRFPIDLYNLYGPTEASIDVTSWRCERDDDRPTVPIGRPIANTRMYITDGALNPVPAGVDGDLYIAGTGLARGYLNRPGMTADTFIPDALGEESGERLYRTGDRARYLPQGEIDFIGRTDGQVKIRGFRIELGEIEESLKKIPQVRDAVVRAHEDSDGDRYLAAYVVMDDGVTMDPSAFRISLERTLPPYMAPSVYFPIEDVPRTSSGKIDRRALQAFCHTRPPTEKPITPPRSPIEEILVGIFADILKIDRLGIHDNFFELGGHSLLAARVLSRIRTLLRVDIDLGRFFDTPHVAGLAEHIEAAGRAEPSRPIPRIGDHNVIFPSFAQQRLWFLHRLDPESAAYNLITALRLRGPLDARYLESALREIIRRHEPLRTTFTDAGGEPMQVVSPETSFQLGRFDLGDLPESEREERALGIATREARRPFDLSSGPLVRAALLRIDEGHHILAITMHHIISDGWSIDALLGELATLYGAYASGEEASLNPLPLRYADFAVWQREHLTGDLLTSRLAYWKETLDGIPAALELPVDFPRPPVQGSNGGLRAFTIPAECAEKLRELSRREGVTHFMTFLAAFETFLYRYTAETDIVVGTPVAGRNRSEIEGLIGFFVNTLALRTDLSGDPSFRELLARVRETSVGAFIHQDLPFEKIVEELHPARDTSRHPIFQVFFAYQANGSNPLKIPELSVEPVAIETGTAKFDLMLVISDSRRSIDAWFEYNSDLLTEETIKRWGNHFVRLLEGIADDPDRRIAELPLLTDDERRLVTIEWNGSSHEYRRDACLHELFEERAAEAPCAIAAVHGDEHLTYDELNRRADALADRLIEKGVGPEICVGIDLSRSIETIVAILGVLKAGGCFLPLDRGNPHDRLSLMAADSGAAVVLTRGAPRGRAPEWGCDVVSLDGRIMEGEANRPESGTCAENAAYVIYTSGSTGRPKGVRCTHGGVVNLLADFGRRAGDPGTARCSFWTNPGFDVSLYEIFTPLIEGGTLEIVPEAVRLDARRFIDYLAERNVTSAYIPPMMLDDLDSHLEGDGRLPALGRLLVGVEPIEDRLLESIMERCPGLTITNGYGPTEATVCATLFDVPRGEEELVPREKKQGVGRVKTRDGTRGKRRSGNTPIGRPVQNTRVYLLDPHMQPVPIGLPGEIHIGGPGLALCYDGRADLTAASFVPDPFGESDEGSRLYRTGDIARHLPDGNIIFMGRADRQTKIRGFRIEPGEIEAAIKRHRAVKDAAVVTRDDLPGGTGLAAYVVTRDGRRAIARDIRGFLTGILPDYMIPSAVVELDELPLTRTGKLDRRALPHPVIERAAFTAPRSETERAVAAVWRFVLGVGRVGVDDNFFDLGGNSLLLAKLHTMLETELKVEIPMVELFRQPTVIDLARYLRREETARSSSERIRERAARKRHVLDDKRRARRTRST